MRRGRVKWVEMDDEQDSNPIAASKHVWPEKHN